MIIGSAENGVAEDGERASARKADEDRMSNQPFDLATGKLRSLGHPPQSPNKAVAPLGRGSQETQLTI